MAKKEMVKKNGATGGEWPIVDLVMVSDYPSPDKASGATTNTPINDCNQWLRIHMDVPYDENSGIEKMLQTGDLAGAYAAILAANPGGKEQDRARAVLAAALGLLDGQAPPPSSKSAAK